MLFCSASFVAFFLAVFAVYWLTPSHRLRVWVLLAASLAFYACWNRWLALLLVVSSTGDYLVGLGLEATEAPRRRKALLLLSLADSSLTAFAWPQPRQNRHHRRRPVSSSFFVPPGRLSPAL